MMDWDLNLNLALYLHTSRSFPQRSHQYIETGMITDTCDSADAETKNNLLVYFFTFFLNNFNSAIVHFHNFRGHSVLD